MKTDKLLILVIFAAALVGIGAVGMLGSPRNAPMQPPSLLAAPAPVEQMRGFCLQFDNAQNVEFYHKSIDEIAATGANTICISVAGYQEHGGSTSIFIDSRKVPSDRDLGELLQHAHRKGLRVVFMPIVLLENPRKQEWRGQINPVNWKDWWEDYTNFVMHFVWTAQSNNVEIFSVGSELISTEDQTDQWRKLIAKVRKHFSGRLSYSANWDHYTVPKFWDDLDVVGMTTYYDLTEGAEPTLDRLMQGWIPIKKDILSWQAKVNKPIIFTEVGWPNQATCAQYPWDYYRSPDKPAPLVQADCFEAFFRTWGKETAVSGILVWEWKNHPDQEIGPRDTSYVPCGKPAMNVIQKYFTAANGHKLATSRPASGSAPAGVVAPEVQTPSLPR
ncbi:MAG: hypothetical protein ABFD92_20510 [Planctomycetaceae bacterium]|nr:hypothetical protein [Planctomycetaceae bacterium]